ncbi:sigma-70 family RNA polymerase sigma factor [Micromonospora sp. DT31]|uniref:sigma-70 family RNA polymerase sigma factor n=1 Tax=Micromonospora sp. DT31 TaxID=3393434 RepID=UPI003CEA4315
MHAVAAGWHGEVARPGWMFARAQPRSHASRVDRGVDARSVDRQNGPVPPSPAPGRHQAASAESVHSDQLIRMLYAEHAGPLLMFVMRLTGGDRQRAEDIVQETLLRAWRNAHRLGVQGQGSLRPWLVTVARRIAIDEHRSEQARPPETYDRDLTAFAEADSTDRVLRTMTVADALRTLSQSHREILVATYFRGRTVPEAAEELGLPLGTAKSRVYYALRALRTALQERGVTE